MRGLLFAVSLAAAAASTGPVFAQAEPYQAEQAERHEEAIALNDVPEAARSAIQKEAKGGNLDKVTKVTMKDGTTLFEAAITKNGKQTVHAFDAKGAPVKPREGKKE